MSLPPLFSLSHLSSRSKFFFLFLTFKHLFSFPRFHSPWHARFTRLTEDPEYSKPPRYTCFARRSGCSRPGKSPGIALISRERREKNHSLFFSVFDIGWPTSFFLLSGGARAGALRFFFRFRFAFCFLVCVLFYAFVPLFSFSHSRCPNSTTTRARERRERGKETCTDTGCSWFAYFTRASF